jgi:hypothetical protein
MNPWERRLKDLSQLLLNCETAYLEPDLFRMNMNQFLQTARTVSFLIQKNKTLIENFDRIYMQETVPAWQADEVMKWAKESRNQIEKEGDLELHSTLTVSLLFSFEEHYDLTIPCTATDLVTATTKRLIRYCRQQMPSGISDVAVIRIERRWVANSLPNREVLQALTYIYGRLWACCQQINPGMNARIADPTNFDQFADGPRRIRYLKLNGVSAGRLKSTRFKRDPAFQPSVDAMSICTKHRDAERPKNLKQAIALFGNTAKENFEHFGGHIPVLYVFDRDWTVIDLMATAFSDQAEKYIFWRLVADRVELLRAHAVIWVTEAWLRNTHDFAHTPMRNLPLKGEQLHVAGLSHDGQREHVSWTIKRDANGIPTLHEFTQASQEAAKAAQNFFRPLARRFELRASGST